MWYSGATRARLRVPTSAMAAQTHVSPPEKGTKWQPAATSYEARGKQEREVRQKKMQSKADADEDGEHNPGIINAGDVVRCHDPAPPAAGLDTVHYSDPVPMELSSTDYSPADTGDNMSLCGSENNAGSVNTESVE